jgi:hypothetical protein
MEQLKEKLRTKLLLAYQGIESFVTKLRLGQATPLEAEILEDLRTEGVHVTTLERLVPDEAGAILAKAADFIATRLGPQDAGLWNEALASQDLRAEALIAELPELYLLGLQDTVLNLVHRYLCLPVAYHGAVVRHSRVNGQSVGPKLWHQDAEDFHVVRLLLYLNDVTQGGGPFEYISRGDSAQIRRQIAAEGGMITAERMNDILPQTRWKRVTGPRGTVVLADSAHVFHHESVQKEHDRFVVMIGYSSTRPKDLPVTLAHFPVEQVKDQLAQIVPPAKREYVFDWRPRKE